jgi:hypothetical protein
MRRSVLVREARSPASPLLKLNFQTRTPAGFALFVRVRPTQMRSTPKATMAGADMMR